MKHPGLILSAATVILANFTVGDGHYQSGFYGAIWTASGLICAGLTKLEFTNGVPILPGDLPGTGHGWHQGWLATVNVAATTEPVATRKQR